MKLHRFIRNVNLNPGLLHIEDEELLNQLKNVFRLGVGDKIILADGHGKEGVAGIRFFHKSGVELEISEISNKNTSGKISTLYLAIIKKDNFELAAQKAVECGITQIVPIITTRTVKMNLNMERLRKISIEAAEQCGRADIPEISEPIKFNEAVERSSGENVFLDMSGKPIGGKLDNSGRLSVWVGPEGGWNENELELARIKGFKVISLGTNTLRAETAAIVASYLISH